MRLEKLELQGFKSFASRVEVHFDEGITAVVGPNGSGKSNIADAIRWVLGEQSAKMLRGGKMEDIIFNGSKSKRAQAYCEVALTFDNSDETLPVAYQEIAVMRRVYRNGDSEYFINRNACRLRDIIDLFRDTGVGKEGYSIIGQGRVDEILSGRSEDRRAIFEEAAGINKYKARKEDAQRKLIKTRDNLLRLEDLISELEMRLEPLRQQSEKAQTYLKWREELKEVEISAFLQQSETLSQQEEHLRQLAQQLDEEYAQAAENQQKITAEQTALKERERHMQQESQNRQAQLVALTGAWERSEGQKNLLQERCQTIRKQQAQWQQDLAETKEQQEQLAHILLANAEKLQLKQAEQEKLQQAIEQDSALLHQQHTALTAQEEQQEERKHALMAAINQNANAKIQQARLEDMRTSLEEQKTKAQQEKAKQDQALQSILDELETQQQTLCQYDQEQQQLTAANTQIRQRLENMVAQKTRWQDERTATEKQRQEASTRLHLLREMKEDYEGYYRSVQRLLKDARADTALGEGIIGTVADILTTPKELEICIEVALGSALQQIVCRDEAAAQRAIAHLRTHQYGRATFLPLRSIQPRLLHAKERMTLDRQGVLGIAGELVQHDAALRPAIEHLLGRTVVVQTLETGIALSRANRQSFRIVSLQGDLINSGGAITGGSRQKQQFALLGREREMAELTQVLAEYARTVHTFDEKTGIIDANIAQQQEKLSATAARWEAMQLERVRHHEKHQTLERLKQDALHTLQENAEALTQIEHMLQDMAQQKNSMAQQRLSADAQETWQQDIAKHQQELQQKRREKDAALDAHNAKKMELQALQNQLAMLQNEQTRRQDEKKQCQERTASHLQALAQAQAEQKQHEDQLQALLATMQEQQQAQAGLADEQTAWQQQQLELDNAQQQCADQLETGRQRLQELETRRQRIAFKREKVELERQGLQTRIWNDYEISYQEAQAYPRKERVGDVQKEARRLRALMRELGEVNVNAIEDYANVKQRHEQLSGQKQDLQQADNDLSALIEQLLQTMSARFKEQFAVINQNFQTTFCELFGGGEAALRLGNAQDALQGDIEIIAKPPGKNLQLLSLLSGGERALTAIALLFSILQLKPTPFCVLDEIEASLDEANVDHFANYVKKYSENTQFILITHRKGSMMVSDALYGVAMEGDGVSKLVSVRFNEAEKYLKAQ